MTTKGTTTVEVEIYGGRYHVRGDNDPEYLQELASLVDEKMNEVARHVATVDTAKLAILAALNVADELFRCRKHQDGERVEITEKVAELAGELEAALQG
jgi:cell division protein ZapA